MSYEPVVNSLPGGPTESQEVGERACIPLDWRKGPHTLRLGHFESFMSWTWDIVLTLTPACFFGKDTTQSHNSCFKLITM
jgi:hypothetical protein